MCDTTMDELTYMCDGSLNTEIEIKEEPLDAVEDEFTTQEEESWTVEPFDLISVKREKNEETDSDENTLEPVTAVDVRAAPLDIKHEQPFKLIKVKVNGTNKSFRRCGKSNRDRVAMYRSQESPEQRYDRLKKDRERKARQRLAERSVTAVYQQRLKEERERTARKRSNWTAEQRQEYLRKDRNHKRMKRLEQKVGSLMVEPVVNGNFRQDEGKYTCDICEFTCELDSVFKEHYVAHFQCNTFCCSYCSESFSYMYDLTEHELEHTNGSKPFKCNQCFSEFTSLECLLRHGRRNHRTNSKPMKFKCEICLKTFCSRQAQKVHSQIHSASETLCMKSPFLCEICGKVVTTYQSFQNHHRIHTGEKPYECQECRKKFTAYIGLHYHLRIHTGEKPYQCTDCGKTFTQRSAFVVHAKIHSAERPFICAVCKKGYTTSTLLKIHMKKHESV